MATNCIEWTRYINHDGYGRLKEKNRFYMAHRWTYEQHHGPIPKGLVVRHKCDNPSCVNIDHLELGTKLDNSRDMVERGRSLRGEKNPRSKLSDIQRNEIINSKKTAKELAVIYSVTPNAIQRIRRKGP